jgi:hypothetical protein
MKIILEVTAMVVINRKERFACEGIRFQRHNPDGTIATPQRFLGFANTADLSKVLTNGKAGITMKADHKQAETKTVDFSAVNDASAVTVQEAVTALNAAGFTNAEFAVDEKTGRIKGAYGLGKPAKLICKFIVQMMTNAPSEIPAGNYSIVYEGETYVCKVDAPLSIAGAYAEMIFYAEENGVKENLPYVNYYHDIETLSPSIFNLAGQTALEWASIENNESEQGENPVEAKIIQFASPLAAALDFGQGIKHGGNGLEVISFFEDETVSVGLPKDIKDKEEIDQEGAKGTITRMVIGTTIQGMSPVVTMKQKDYYFLELVQGGRLNREDGNYDPPLSKESDHPSFWGELFSAVYSAGSNKLSDVAGYERILWRTMIGMEGDVPAEAKAWAVYVYNLTATEYTDENGESFSAWQEQAVSLEKFDGLHVKQISL